MKVAAASCRGGLGQRTGSTVGCKAFCRACRYKWRMSLTNKGPVLILGAGGHGKVVADLLASRGTPAAGFIDADESLHGSTVAGLPVLGGMNRLEHHARQAGASAVALAIGDNRVRLEHAREASRAGLDVATLVHPAATVSASATLGPGRSYVPGPSSVVKRRSAKRAW